MDIRFANQIFVWIVFVGLIRTEVKSESSHEKDEKSDKIDDKKEENPTNKVDDKKFDGREDRRYDRRPPPGPPYRGEPRYERPRGPYDRPFESYDRRPPGRGGDYYGRPDDRPPYHRREERPPYERPDDPRYERRPSYGRYDGRQDDRGTQYGRQDDRGPQYGRQDDRGPQYGRQDDRPSEIKVGNDDEKKIRDQRTGGKDEGSNEGKKDSPDGAVDKPETQSNERLERVGRRPGGVDRNWDERRPGRPDRRWDERSNRRDERPDRQGERYERPDRRRDEGPERTDRRRDEGPERTDRRRDEGPEGPDRRPDEESQRSDRRDERPGRQGERYERPDRRRDEGSERPDRRDERDEQSGERPERRDRAERPGRPYDRPERLDRRPDRTDDRNYRRDDRRDEPYRRREDRRDGRGGSYHRRDGPLDPDGRPFGKPGDNSTQGYGRRFERDRRPYGGGSETGSGERPFTGRKQYDRSYERRPDFRSTTKRPWVARDSVNRHSLYVEALNEAVNVLHGQKSYVDLLREPIKKMYSNTTLMDEPLKKIDATEKCIHGKMSQLVKRAMKDLSFDEMLIEPFDKDYFTELSDHWIGLKNYLLDHKPEPEHETEYVRMVDMVGTANENLPIEYKIVKSIMKKLKTLLDNQ